MSVSHRIFCGFTLTLHSRFSSSSCYSSRNFLFLRFRSLCFSRSLLHSTIPHNQRKGGSREQRWMEKPNANKTSSSFTAMEGVSAEAVTNGLNTLRIAENSGESGVSAPVLEFGSVGLANHVPVQGQKAFWKPKSCGTISGATMVEVEKESGLEMAGEIQGNGAHTTSSEVNNAVLSKLFKENLLESFTVDNNTYSQAQIRATFYPKFENEKSDHEIRIRMIEMVSKGLASLEVSLKHSGSLFMYAGHKGGAYAKNSFGNMCAHT